MSEELEDTTEVESDQISLDKVRDTYQLRTLKMKDSQKMSYAWSFNNFRKQLKIDTKTLYYRRANESECVLTFEDKYQIFLKRVEKKLNVNVDIQRESKSDYIELEW